MRKYIYRILNYFLWTLIAYLFACVYIRILLGPLPESSTGMMAIFDFFYKYALFYLWAIIGGVLAFLYILIDIFYLNKRLKNIANATIIRLLVFIGISIFVGVVHYVLEKVIDVI